MCGFTYPLEKERNYKNNREDDWALPWYNDPNRDYFEDVENRKNNESSIYDGPPC